jgi:Anti-sigma factor NepR
MPSSLQYPLDRHRELQQRWSRLLHEPSLAALLSVPNGQDDDQSDREINPPPQSVWLSAIGHGLRLQYDEVLGAPVPPRLVALLGKLET